MNKRQIEINLKTAIEQTTPDVLDNVLSQCGAQNGKVMKMKTLKNKRRLKSVASVAAALVLIVGAFFVVASMNNSVYSTVTLDVNPSIEIKLTEKEKVLEVNPLNDDAVTVLGDMDFKNSSLDVTVNAIIGSMVRNGYIDELSNSILISVDSKNETIGNELQAKLNSDIEKLLDENDCKGAVLSHTVKHNDDLDDKAEKYGITIGKALLIEKIIAADNRYTFEELAKLTINELNLIGNGGTDISDSVTVQGNSSEKQYIGFGRAKDIALAHAGVTTQEITEYDAEFDYEDGKMVYEIEFNVGNVEYDYDIDAKTGEIVKSFNEIDDDIDDDDDEHFGNDNGAGNGAGDNYINRQTAKQNAFVHAGVNEADCRKIEIELDTENGVTVYSVDFECGGYEYDYDIDATTGAVLHFEKELAD